MYAIIAEMTRSQKRIVLLFVDFLLVFTALYLSFALKFSSFFVGSYIQSNALILGVVCVLSPVVILAVGLNKYKVEAFEKAGVVNIGVCAIALAVCFAALNFILEMPIAGSIPILFGAMFFIGSLSSRYIAQWFLVYLFERDADNKRILIYGAGRAGIQIASGLKQVNTHKLVGFVDDNNANEGLMIGGLKVYGAANLDDLIARKRVDRIVFAIPSLTGVLRRELLKKLADTGCEVQTLPAYDQLLDGQNILDKIRPVSAEDLLGREAVDLDLPEVALAYAGKTVMITGAGGSIGSELCRQLLLCKIKKLVLFDHSEFNLYTIGQELTPEAQDLGIDIKWVLGSVTNEYLVDRTLANEGVQIVLHAAAYKHVPIVEANEVSGLVNNVLGTNVVANAARRLGLERFILISTDKAVRPTNIMGATKRMAELVIQDQARKKGTTLFSMVRFGNVLGSSGSVIPLFQKQIQSGGPVTVTHAEVTRYFMTIPEASRLVLLCGGYARGGDVFVLDMGDPKKIIDMARSMIELSGLKVKDDENPDGDIAVEVVGLRPGEKLYEELLIGNDMLTTPHSKIMRAQESMLSEIEVASMLKEVSEVFILEDSLAVREIVIKWVSGYQFKSIDPATV